MRRKRGSATSTIYAGSRLIIGAQDHGIQRDVDTYFRTVRGRLKLRVNAEIPGGTLIAYQRPDQVESRISDYQLIRVLDPEALLGALVETLGVLVTVRKSRRLLLLNATRIHLDDVDGLGTFVELETVLSTQTVEEAEEEHRFLRRLLDLDGTGIVPVSYSDLIMEQND